MITYSNSDSLMNNVFKFSKNKKREAAHKYYMKNREKCLAASKKYYETHKDACRKLSNDWYYKNHDKARAMQKKYYEENKDMIREKYKHHRRAWEAQHRLYCNEHARLLKHMKNGDETAAIKKEYLRELHSKNMLSE